VKQSLELNLANRVTLIDVAKEAGLSLSTVDRAINGRGTVRPETLKNIAEAARRIGYHGRRLLDGRFDDTLPKITFGFILLKQSQEFYLNLVSEIEAAIAARNDIRGEVKIRFSKSQSPAEFSDLLTEVGETCDVVAAIAVNDPRLDRTVSELKERGVPVFSLLNDFAQGIRKSYVGMNNMKIGRVAAWMITRTVKTPGKLAIFVGGNRWHGHDLREAGFRSFVREAAPDFTVLDTLVNLETRKLTYEATLDLVDRHPDIKGIYVAGGGMEGAIAALREVHAEPQVALVVNELTVESRSALADGYAVMVIATPLNELCTKVIDKMITAHLSDDDGVSDQHFLAPLIHLPEMI